MPRKAKAKIVKESPVASSDILDNVQVEAPVSAEKISNSDIFDSVEGELVVDVFETKNDFVVLAAIAGVEIKNLDIAVEKDIMVIKGARQNPHGADQKYFYQECYWGAFSRKIVLPENLNTESTEAEISKGILTIKIPKMGETKGETQVA